MVRLDRSTGFAFHHRNLTQPPTGKGSRLDRGLETHAIGVLTYRCRQFRDVSRDVDVYPAAPQRFDRSQVRGQSPSDQIGVGQYPCRRSFFGRGLLGQCFSAHSSSTSYAS